MGIGIFLGIVLGICLTLSITASLIVKSNYVGDKKGNRYHFGDINGAYYYDGKNKYGDINFYD